MYLTFDEIIEIMNELNSDFSSVSVVDEDYQEKFENNISNDDENSVRRVTISFGSQEKKKNSFRCIFNPFHLLFARKQVLFRTVQNQINILLMIY